MAWFLLAHVHHHTGDLRLATEVGERAATFAEVRPTALYNLACAHALLGEVDTGLTRLKASIEAGFLDFDHLLVDEELAALREEIEPLLPPANEYRELRAANRVVIPYRVLLPEGYDAQREYPVVVSFAPGGGGPRATDWTLAELWNDPRARDGLIVVAAVAPERGWMNHPAHHALEDLFDHLRDEYRVAGERFHLFGFADGSRAAATYSRMSRRYTASLIVASGRAFRTWDASDFSSMRTMPTRQIVGLDAPYELELARAAQRGFEKAEVPAELIELQGQGPLLEECRGAHLRECVFRGRIGD